MTDQYFANLRQVKVFSCARVTVIEGEGTPASLVRQVDYYFNEQGEFLWANDPAKVITRPDQSLKDVDPKMFYGRDPLEEK